MPEINKPDGYKSINSSSLQLNSVEETKEVLSETNKESIEVSETDLDIVTEPYLNKIIQYRILAKKDETNDYYFVQYLAKILDYIERDYKGCLTESGNMSLEVDTSIFFEKLNNKKELTQKELVCLCLNLTNSYATCVLFKGMIEVYKQIKEGFTKQNPLPNYIFEDFLLYEDRVTQLLTDYQKIMNSISSKLQGEYRTIYNSEKHKGFYKQIFAEQFIRNRSSLPSDITNAIEMK